MLRPRTRPRPGHVLPAGVRRARRRGAVGLAVRRPPRVAEQPRRRRRARRHHAVLPGRRPGRVAAARRRAARPLGAGRGPGPRAGPLAAARARRPRGAAAARPGRHRRRQPHLGRRGRPGASRWPGSGATTRFPDAVEQAKLQALSDAIDARPASTMPTTPRSRSPPTPKGAAGAELDAAQRELLRALLGDLPRPRPGRGLPTAAATTTTRRSTPSTSPGPARPSPASRTTTACRARGCSIEWDNTQRGEPRARRVARPGGRLRLDVLAAHRAAHH